MRRLDYSKATIDVHKDPTCFFFKWRALLKIPNEQGYSSYPTYQETFYRHTRNGAIKRAEKTLDRLEDNQRILDESKERLVRKDTNA